MDCQLFENFFLKTLDMHAPRKKRYARANGAPFMNSNPIKLQCIDQDYEISSLSLETETSRNAYAKHRNYCVCLFQEEKIKIYNNLNLNLITDNKKILETG